jgi:hypothetical protein
VVVVSVITNQRVNYAFGIDRSDVGPVGDIHSFVGGNRQAFGMRQTSIFRRSFVTALTVVPRYASFTVTDDLQSELLAREPSPIENRDLPARC